MASNLVSAAMGRNAGHLPFSLVVVSSLVSEGIGWNGKDSLFSLVCVPIAPASGSLVAFVVVDLFFTEASAPLDKASRDLTLDQDDKSLCVEELLIIESVRFIRLEHGMTGFHDRGAEWDLLLVQQGSSKHKNL